MKNAKVKEEIIMKNIIILTLTLCPALGTVAQADLMEGLLVAHDFNNLVLQRLARATGALQILTIF